MLRRNQLRRGIRRKMHQRAFDAGDGIRSVLVGSDEGLDGVNRDVDLARGRLAG